MRLNAKEVKSEDDIQGKPRPKPGTYHWRVVHAEIKDFEFTDDNGEKQSLTKLNVEAAVLAGTIPGQEGLTLQFGYTISDDPRDMAKLTRFAICTGVLRPGEERDVDFENELTNKQFIAAIEEKEGTGKNKGKKFTNCAEYGMAVWAVNNPNKRDIPKDKDALLHLGQPIDNPAYSNGGNGTNGNGNGSQQQQQQSQQKQSAGAAAGGGEKQEGGWDDL